VCFSAIAGAGLVGTAAGGSTVMSTVNPDDWLSECFGLFEDFCCVAGGGLWGALDKQVIEFSNFELITEPPSGLCVDHLSCAFDKCDPTGIDAVARKLKLHGMLTYDEVKRTLGTLNLPEEMAFVETASDIVDAIKFAKQNGLTVSVKATGHSFTGSSTVKGSVQLNLRNFHKYSPVEGAVECANVADESSDDFATCQLAASRGKIAFVRVGGGELWSEVYFALFPAENATRYEIVGGAAGSVGAAGGWLQGGGFAAGLDRQYGLGVDNLLEIEMVLADERHVKFYPTEWEPAEDYMYPRTTAVGGKCNSNVSPDESEWVWEACEDPAPPFEDLWYAVRGGGGGTWGVVTSVKYQLHEAKPMDFVYVSQYNLDEIVDEVGRSSATFEKAARVLVFFLVDFFFNPSNLGLTEEISNNCGGPSVNFNGFMDIDDKNGMAPYVSHSTRDTFFVCYDGALANMTQAWHSTVDDTVLDNPDMYNITEQLKAIFVSFEESSYPDAMVYIEKTKDPDFAEDRVPDDPPPMYTPWKGFGGWCSSQIPHTWLREKNEDVFELLRSRSGEHMQGGNVAIAHDQMTSVSPSQRGAGLTSVNLANLDPAMEKKLLSSFLKDAAAAGDSFPGITELNHVCPDSYGPLKTDMTTPCPPEYTTDQKEQDCYSIQESVWGVEILAKLEAIKSKVDPDNLFDCYPCVKPADWSATPTVVLFRLSTSSSSSMLNIKHVI
jgi:FAD/FMN-containing dehydrogenase